MPVYDVAGRSVFAEVRGAGLPVVFLHGFPLAHQMWQDQIAELSKHHRIIALDFPGFGRSGSAGESCSMSQMGDAVIGVLDAAGITEPVVLCGLSMGGYVAFSLWAERSTRICALVLSDTKAEADTDEARAGRMALIEKLKAEGARAAAEAMLPKMMRAGVNESQPAVFDRVRNLILAQSSAGISAALRGMAARPDRTDLLSSITVPTLVIGGTEDSITPPAGMEKMAARIPGAEWVEIPKAGHMSPVENPVAFNAALLTFLGGLK